MASPIDNISGLKGMQPIRRSQGLAVKNGGSQQGLQRAEEPQKSQVEQVSEITTSFSSEMEKSTDKSLPEKEQSETSLTQMMEGLQSSSLSPSVGSVSLNFNIDKETGEVVVQVVDKETDEVIRQVPPEEMRQLMARLQASREKSGFFVDTEA